MFLQIGGFWVNSHSRVLLFLSAEQAARWMANAMGDRPHWPIIIMRLTLLRDRCWAPSSQTLQLRWRCRTPWWISSWTWKQRWRWCQLHSEHLEHGSWGDDDLSPLFMSAVVDRARSPLMQWMGQSLKSCWYLNYQIEIKMMSTSFRYFKAIL